MRPSGDRGVRLGGKWQSVLIRMDGSAVEHLLQILCGEDVLIRRKPETGFIMMTARDASDEDFHIGEVLVTEAEVDYQGRRGYGIVMGNDPDRAMAMAALEAAFAAPDAPLARRMERILLAESKKQTRAGLRESGLLASTKVNFETMPTG